MDTEAAESGGHDKCCPHVVDPWLFLGILAGLAVTTFVLRMQITMFIMGKKRRRRKRSNNEIEISITNTSSKLTNLKQDRGKKVILAGELEMFRNFQNPEPSKFRTFLHMICTSACLKYFLTYCMLVMRYFEYVPNLRFI